MTRPLGSFNNRVNLPQHASDFRPVAEPPLAKYPESRLGYLLGITTNKSEREAGLPTGEEKFVSSRGQQNRVTMGMRMAGEAMAVPNLS